MHISAVKATSDVYDLIAVADHLGTFLASLDVDPDATSLPAYVQRAFYDYLRCGILAHGFVQLGVRSILFSDTLFRRGRLGDI